MAAPFARTLDSLSDIRRHARGSLAAAGALETVPVPLPEVSAAVNLRRQDLFTLGKDAPPSMRAIAKKLGGKVLGFLAIEERTIYVDPTLPSERRRFTEGHEIGHDAMPWHNAAYFGEDLHTLASDTKELLEREANAFSAELLFGGGAFAKQSDDYAPSIDVPLNLAARYEVSAAAALRHYVERSHHAVALIVTGRFTNVRGASLCLPLFREQCAQSEAFTKRYGDLHGLVPNELDLAKVPAAEVLYNLTVGRGQETEITLDTAKGKVTFVGETFSNNRLRYMLVHKRSRLDGRKLTLVSAYGVRL